MDIGVERKSSGRPKGGTRVRRSAETSRRREELLDIAIEVIANRGLQACTFRNLAKDAGASTMTYTYEFGNRAGLLEAILDRCGETLWQQRGLDGPADDPLEQLRRAAMGGCQLGDETNPYLRTYDLMLIDAPHDPVIEEVVRDNDSRFLERYVAIIRECQECGQIPLELDPEDLVFQIWSLGDGLNLQRYAHPHLFDSARMTRLFTEGFDSLISGHPA